MKTASDCCACRLLESFAVNWLINRLKRFSSRHPDLDIRLTSQNQIDDFGNVIGKEKTNWVDLKFVTAGESGRDCT